MTEAEWLTSNDPQAMLKSQRTRISDRQLRLFVCACCRQVWHLLTDERMREAVETAEQYADKSISLSSLRIVNKLAEVAANGKGAYWNAVWLPYYATMEVVNSELHWTLFSDYEKSIATRILREIVGNPYRLVKAPLLTPQILSLARVAYIEKHEKRCKRCGGTGRMEKNGADHKCGDCWGVGVSTGTLDNETLATLSDALEEAGCIGELTRCPRNCWIAYGVRLYSESGKLNDACSPAHRCNCVNGKVRATHPLVAHLRSEGPHYRGCWALEVLRGN